MNYRELQTIIENLTRKERKTKLEKIELEFFKKLNDFIKINFQEVHYWDYIQPLYGTTFNSLNNAIAKIKINDKIVIFENGIFKIN